MSPAKTTKAAVDPAGLTTRVRSTRQGAAVETVLAQSSGFRSAQELHARLRERGDKIGLTTVYRHLTTLVDGGFVDSLQTPEGEAVYRLCSSGTHHHHLVCRSCGATVEVDGPEVESWASAVAKKSGYTEVSHTIEIFGTCKKCR